MSCSSGSLEFPTPHLAFRGVSYSYRSGRSITRALSKVSLEVTSSEIVALLGSNGAGKSTLLSVATGHVPPDEGEVRFGGAVHREPDCGHRRFVGFASQHDAVYPSLTVRQNLEFFGRLGGLKGRVLAGRLNQVAESLELQAVMRRAAGRLSGGQRKRLHTGVAIMHNPSLLLLDEPSVGLDQPSATRLLSVIRSLSDSGAAILYSTHQLPEVEELNARVLILDHGKLIAEGSVSDLVDAFAPPLVSLVFSDDEYGVPRHLTDSLESATWTSEGLFNVVARVDAPGIPVTEVINRLDSMTRRALLSASIREPSLDVAYRRAVRMFGSSAAPRAGVGSS